MFSCQLLDHTDNTLGLTLCSSVFPFLKHLMQRPVNEDVYEDT